MATRKLFLSGISVVRDRMGTSSNPLIFAFAGGAISTLLSICGVSFQYTQIIGANSIGIGIRQGMTGSLGVILTVPIVASLSAVLLRRFPDAPAPVRDSGSADRPESSGSKIR